MKKLSLLFVSIAMMFFINACTIHIPMDLDGHYDQYKIVFKVDPEDALILLNGRTIGEAYEFSTRDSALTLASKSNEIIIKRKGFTEEVIDLYEFKGKEIVIRVALKRDNKYGRKAVRIKKREISESRSKHRGKKVLEKEVTDAPLSEAVKTARITLKITPEDAAIYINKQFWGVVPTSGEISNIVLKKGKYQVEVVKPGFVSAIKTVVIDGKKANITMKIDLKKK